MANDIYTTTLGGLTELVSPRVAEGVLDRALTAVAVDRDDVDARTMSRLLRGRIRRDLERILPPAGLRRSLAAIDAGLRDRSVPVADDASAEVTVPSPDPDPAASTPPHRRRAPFWRREPSDRSEQSVRRRAFPIAGDDRTPTTPQPDEPAAGDASHAEPPSGEPPSGEPLPGHPLPGAGAPEVPPAATAIAAPQRAPEPAPRRAAHPATEPAAARPADAPRPVPTRAVARVTEQEGVRQWVWAAGPRQVEGRGEGPDTSRVASEVRAIHTVLGRHGRLRSLHVRHGTGQVLVGTVRGAALVVAGDEGVNVGAIYAAFRALEEES